MGLSERCGIRAVPGKRHWCRHCSGKQLFQRSGVGKGHHPIYVLQEGRNASGSRRAVEEITPCGSGSCSELKPKFRHAVKNGSDSNTASKEAGRKLSAPKEIATKRHKILYRALSKHPCLRKTLGYDAKI